MAMTGERTMIVTSAQIAGEDVADEVLTNPIRGAPLREWPGLEPHARGSAVFGPPDTISRGHDA
jgi:hypothetical protein